MSILNDQRKFEHKLRFIRNGFFFNISTGNVILKVDSIFH